MKPAARILFPAATMIWLGFASMASNQYHTLMLEQRHHFSATAIGSTVALGASTQILLPWLLLLFGKCFRNSDRVLRRSYMALGLCLAAFPFVSGHLSATLCYYGVIAATSVGSTLQAITIIAQARPQGETWVLLLRSVGTFGYAASCLLSSLIADKVGYEGLYLVFAFWAFVAVIASKLAGQGIPPDDTPLHLRDTFACLKERNTRNLLIAISLANLAIAGATSVLSNFIYNELGGSKSQVGFAWTIATFAEMPLIWGSIFFLRRFGIKGLILTGVVCSTLRMGLLSQVQSFEQFYTIQILHGVFFGASLSGIGLWLAKRHGTGRMLRLQLVCQSIYGGVGATIGGQSAGLIWEAYGLRTVYASAFFLLLIALGVIIWGFNDNMKPTEVVE